MNGLVHCIFKFGCGHLISSVVLDMADDSIWKRARIASPTFRWFGIGDGIVWTSVNRLGNTRSHQHLLNLVFLWEWLPDLAIPCQLILWRVVQTIQLDVKQVKMNMINNRFTIDTKQQLHSSPLISVLTPSSPFNSVNNSFNSSLFAGFQAHFPPHAAFLSTLQISSSENIQLPRWWED